QKNILTNDGHVSFENALAIWMPKHRLRVFVRLLRDAAGVSLPRREADAPAIRARLCVLWITLRAQMRVGSLQGQRHFQTLTSVFARQCLIFRQRLGIKIVWRPRFRRLHFTSAHVPSWQFQRCWNLRRLEHWWLNW